MRPDTSDDESPLTGRWLNGRYYVGEKVGAGGMGTLYRAHDRQENADVAIKVLSPELADDPVQRERFLREVMAGRRLRHPNVAEVLAHGEDQGAVYLVMEFLVGRTLAECVRGQRLGALDALSVLMPVVHALGFAHARGVVHRDVKPANIFITDEGPAAERVKLLDFGVARILSEHTITAAREVLGTMSYLSPEQCRGERATHLSDLYSFGVTLFETLAGRTPFEGSVEKVLVAHAITPPPRLRALVPDVPEALDAIVDRLLAKDPAARHPDAGSLARELDAVVRALSPTVSALGAAPSSPPEDEARTLDTLMREHHAEVQEIRRLDQELQARRARLANLERRIHEVKARLRR
jgi:serine/threonine-protein kinase